MSKRTELEEFKKLGYTPRQLEYMIKFFKEHTSDDFIEEEVEDFKKIREFYKYQKLEEEGQLVIFPCKPNEIVWVTAKGIKPHTTVYVCQSHILSDMEDGCVIGYSKEDVLKKLKEKKNGK